MQKLITTFNTGVGYSQEGQRIAYMPLAHRGDSTTLVAMVGSEVRMVRQGRFPIARLVPAGQGESPA